MTGWSSHLVWSWITMPSMASASTWSVKTGSARFTQGRSTRPEHGELPAALPKTGGTGIFTRPATEMKCAGAPLKHTFLIDDIARRAGNSGRVNMVYAAPQGSLFGVPIVAEKVRMLFEDRGVETMMNRTLTAIDASAKRATFEDKETGTEEVDYDYIHVIPPQRAPEFVVQSGLAWVDRWTDQGWVECRHANPAASALPRDFRAWRRGWCPKRQDGCLGQMAGSGG